MLAIPTAVCSVFIGFATLLQGANVGPELATTGRHSVSTATPPRAA
jgi:hypothetical protein